MKTSVICRIEREIEEEKKELELLESNVDKIRESLVEKIPGKFSKKDIINAFFGSLFLGITFVFKGGMITVSLNLDLPHILLTIGATLLILMVEIYFISYIRVRDRTRRHLGQFMTKRLITLYTITLIVTLGLIYILNLNNLPGVDNHLPNVIKMVVATSFPCAIGAAVPSLLKKY